MRHKNKTLKLGLSQSHRDALFANQLCSLIEESRIKTTLAKAKAVRPLADRLITLAKKNTLAARRHALALLHSNSKRTEKAVAKLFAEIAPRSASRNGGYSRIIKLGFRNSDASRMALIEWVDAPAPAEEETVEVTPKAKAKKTKTAVETPATEAAEPKKKSTRKPKAKAEDDEEKTSE
jgi:large subunit ribosomal protein L17